MVSKVLKGWQMRAHLLWGQFATRDLFFSLYLVTLPIILLHMSFEFMRIVLLFLSWKSEQGDHSLNYGPFKKQGRTVQLAALFSIWKLSYVEFGQNNLHWVCIRVTGFFHKSKTLSLYILILLISTVKLKPDWTRSLF